MKIKSKIFVDENDLSDQVKKTIKDLELSGYNVEVIWDGPEKNDGEGPTVNYNPVNPRDIILGPNRGIEFTTLS